MPFRLEPQGFPGRAKIQFTTYAAMPHQIYQACLATGVISNTVYCQRALVEALARDLKIPLDSLLAELPTPRGPSGHLYDPAEGTMRRDVTMIQNGGVLLVGPANTDENVR